MKFLGGDDIEFTIDDLDWLVERVTGKRVSTARVGYEPELDRELFEELVQQLRENKAIRVTVHPVVTTVQ